MAQAERLTKPTDGPVSRLINRRISTRITRMLVRLGVSNPNAVTLFTGALGVLSALPYLLVDPLMAALAGFLVQLSSILDGVDGEIARMLGRKSRFGAYLDAVTDRIVDIASFGFASYAAALGVGLDAGASSLLSTLTVSAALMVSYVHARGEASLGTSIQLLGRLRPWASRDVRLFLLAVGSLLVPLLSWEALLATLVAVSIASYTYVAAKTVELWLLWRKGVIG